MSLPPVAPVDPECWRESPDYLWGARLFDAGYYWEAHEVWERVWHAQGRHGAVADLCKALIKLAAAGVKVRQGQPRGVTTHAQRAADLLSGLRSMVGSDWMGLDLDRLAGLARSVAADPPSDITPRGTVVHRVFAFRLDLGA